MEIVAEKCITCLGETSIMHALTEMYDDFLDLGGLLKICLHCEINKPYLPKLLCDLCMAHLKDLFSFKLLFINNEIMMRNRFKQHNNDRLECNEEEIQVEPIEEDIIFEVVPDLNEDLTPKIHPQDTFHEINVECKKFEKSTDFKCSICNAFFIDSYTLESHSFEHKKHVCVVCGDAFVRKSYLTDHLTTHKDIKDILCPLCPKAFKNRHTMRAHMRIHTNPGSFICELCGQCFTQKGTLNTHVKLKHSEKRDYLCLWCGLKFKLKASLDKHTQRKHCSIEDRKTFKCSKCSVQYFDKSTLYRHIKTKHSESEPVQCERCHKTFIDKGNLLRHKRVKHSEEIMKVM